MERAYVLKASHQAKTSTGNCIFSSENWPLCLWAYVLRQYNNNIETQFCGIAKNIKKKKRKKGRKKFDGVWHR